MSLNRIGSILTGGLLATLATSAGCDVSSAPDGERVATMQPLPDDERIWAPLDPEAINEPNSPWYQDAAWAVAESQIGARSLAVSPAGLFWIADHGEAPMVHVTGTQGQTVPMHMRLDMSPTAAMARSGEAVFEYDRGLYRLVDHEMEKIASFDATPIHLAARGDELVIATDDGCVHSLPDGADEPDELACGAGEPLALAVDDDEVFWGSTDGYVYRASGGVAAPVKKPGMADHLLVDDDALYWVEDGKVMTTDRDGSGAITVATQAQNPIVDLVADRFFVYYATKNDGAVWQYDKTTGANRLLTTGWSDPRELTLAGAARIYFVDPIAGVVVTQRL
jgi:hypothetical protein